MKCIAAVTMFFLPGTFVASLLSVPLFDWGADSPRVMYRPSYWKPRAAMFLALTLPLMSLTFGAWGFWSLAHKVRERRKAAVAQAQLRLQVSENETKALSMKRASLSEKS
jgi:hypothetical protein